MTSKISRWGLVVRAVISHAEYDFSTGMYQSSPASPNQLSIKSTKPEDGRPATNVCDIGPSLKYHWFDI